MTSHKAPDWIPERPAKPKAEIRGVIKCSSCGWYIGRKIVRSRGKCANCGVTMKEKR